VSKRISTFLSENKEFDFAGSRVHDFDDQIKAVAETDFDEVRGELMKIQRAFQVSMSPKVMVKVIESNLNSAYTIANIPSKSFVKTYGELLGGDQIAFAVHQRASHIAARSEMYAMRLRDYSHGVTPHYALGPSLKLEAVKAIENHLPN